MILKILHVKNLGCKFQINLGSTTGYYGNEVIKITDRTRMICVILLEVMYIT